MRWSGLVGGAILRGWALINGLARWNLLDVRVTACKGVDIVALKDDDTSLGDKKESANCR